MRSGVRHADRVEKRVGESHFRIGIVTMRKLSTSQRDRSGRPLKLEPSSGEELRHTDAEMVFALRRGDAWAPEASWERLSDRIHRFFLRALGPPNDEIADLTREVFLRTWTCAHAIREPMALALETTRECSSSARGIPYSMYAGRLYCADQHFDSPTQSKARSRVSCVFSIAHHRLALIVTPPGKETTPCGEVSIGTCHGSGSWVSSRRLWAR